jgi:hypothetical protein
MSTKKIFAAIAASLLFASAALPAHAEDVDKAKTLYNAGADAYAAGNFLAAIQAFSAAYAISPRPAILFNLAQAERRQFTLDHDAAKLRDAIKHFRQYLAEVQQGGRRSDAVEALADLEAQASRLGDAGMSATAAPVKAVTRLMISCDVKEATITVDATAHTEVPVIDEVKPGKHTVKVSAPGYFDDVREVTAVEGNLIAAEVTLKERPATLAFDAPSGADISVDGRPVGTAPMKALELPSGAHTITLTRAGKRPFMASVTLKRGEAMRVPVSMETTDRRVASYVVFGTAGVGALVGGFFVLDALHFQNTAKGIRDEAASGNITGDRLSAYNDAITKRDSMRSASYVAFGITGGLLLTAGALYFFDHPVPRSGDEIVAPPASPRVAFLPVVLPGGGGGMLVGAF